MTYLHQRVGILNGAAIVRNNERYALGTSLDAANATQLVGGFFRGDPVDGETAFHVVDEPEVFTGSLNAHDI